jgi:hypothetical protein
MGADNVLLYEKQIWENKENKLTLEILNIDQDNGIVEVKTSSWIHSREIKIKDLYREIKINNLTSK